MNPAIDATSGDAAAGAPPQPAVPAPATAGVLEWRDPVLVLGRDWLGRFQPTVKAEAPASAPCRAGARRGSGP